MTNKWIAIPILFAVILGAGALLALDPGQIAPTSATADVATRFSYSGEGTPTKWCFVEAGASSSECQGSNSTFTFGEVGDAYVQVTLHIAGTGAATVTQKVLVSAP